MRSVPRALSTGQERPSSILVGVGGAGCNAVAISQMKKFNIVSDRDQNHEGVTSVRLSSSELEIFRTTSLNFLTVDLPAIRRMSDQLDEHEVVFIFTGLGGETGSHAAPVLANICKRKAKLVVSVVCTPFSVEGKDRHKHASEGLGKLAQLSDLCIVLENDGLAKAAPQMQFRKAFRVMDQVMNFIPGEMQPVLTRDSLKDVKDHFRACRECRLGVGIGKGPFADRTAMQEAFDSPWFDERVGSAPACLAMIAVGEGMEHLVQPLLQDLCSRMPSSSVLYSVRTDPELQDRVQATVLVGLG